MYVRRLDSTIVREVAGGGQVINVNTGEDCNVNETGQLFLSFIDERVQNVETILNSIYNCYEDIDHDVIRNDFNEFLSLMEKRKFVTTASKREEIDNYTLESLHVDVTSECNERCIHCYIPNAVKNQATHISLQKFCEIIDEFVELGGNSIVLSGGEPLMHPEITKILNCCGQKNLDIAVFSNLTLLDKSLIEAMKTANVRLVQASIYSIKPDIHDRITKKKGSLEKTLSAIKILQSEGIDVQMACPVMKQNKDDVVNIMRYAKENNISLRTNSLILPTFDGDDSFVKSSALTLEQKRTMICEMMRADKDYTKDVLLELNNNSNELYNNPKGFLNSSLCTAGINSCSISIDGNVCPCPKWQSYYLGNVYKNSLSEIWYNNPLLSLIRRINKQRNFQECLNCKAIDYCKRCLKLNEQTTQGGLLRFSRENCEYAWMTKEILENYEEQDD